MDMLFPYLVVLGDKFVDARYRPDMVAFDEKRRAFVVIEFKDRMSRAVFDQVQVYLSHMEKKKEKDTLVKAYRRQTGHSPPRESDRGGAYAIIMSPRFTNLQKISARVNRSLALYRVSAYGDEIMSLAEVVVHKKVSEPDAAKGAGPAAVKSGPGDALYRDARERIRGKLKALGMPEVRMEERSKNDYRELRDPDGVHICTARVLERHVWIAYQKKGKEITVGDDFEDLLPGLAEYYVAKKRGRIVIK